MTRARWFAVAIGVAAALLLARAFAVAFVEYRWFAALGPGALDVWRARAIDLTVLRATAAALAGAFLYVNLLGVASTIDAVAVSRRLGGIEIAETVPAGRLRGVFAIASVAFGLAMALPITDWVATDALLSGHALGEIEPYTQHDLAFFLYWLPFENGMYAWVLVAVAFVTGVVVALYALTPGLRWSGGRIRTTVRVRRHLALFGVATLLLLAWGHRLDAYALLVDGSGSNGAFVGLDERALLPTRFGLAILSALAAIVVLRAGWAGQARLAFWAVTSVVVTTILGRSLAGPLASALVPPGSLATANVGASVNRALYSRRAFAADQVREAAVAAPPLAAPAGAVANVASWDAAALARAASPVVDGRPLRAVVGWQTAGDTLVAVLAAPRVALDGAGPAPRGRDAARSAGWRAILVEPRTTVPLVAAARGAGSVGAPVDVAGIFYPGATDSVVSDPSGRVVGDSFRMWGIRLAAALAARDLRLLAAPDDDRVDRRLIRRADPRARVQALLPFFTIAHDATPIIAGDTLWWAVSVLAASADYPLAAHLTLDSLDGDEVASVRHAGTALVNAATGSVRVIAAPEPDADIRAWYARFPRIASRADAVDPALLAALPVPYDAALAQARTYAEFGPRSAPATAARRVQLSEPPDAPGAARPGGAFAAVGATGRTGVATAFPVITTADRVDGAMLVTGGAVPRSVWIASPTPGPRWQDVLDSTATIVDSAGARAGAVALADGGVHTVPTSAGLLFVRAHYGATADGRPTLAGVTGVLGDRVLRAPTARELLDTTTVGRGGPRPVRALSSEQRLGAARARYDDARGAFQRGDWAAFGRALDALGRLLAPVP